MLPATEREEDVHLRLCDSNTRGGEKKLIHHSMRKATHMPYTRWEGTWIRRRMPFFFACIVRYADRRTRTNAYITACVGALKVET